MTIASSLHTMSNGAGSSSNSYLMSKNDLTITDNELIDVLLHGQNTESKIQIVNHWCKSSRPNRISSIVDASQRHDILLSLVNTLQQTTNTEYQCNCLTLLFELQTNIQHYDQRMYLPAIIQCFSSTSNDVQNLTSQLLIKQIQTTNDVATFLYIYTHDGLKSLNIRISVRSIEILTDLLNKSHYHENLSQILEVLLGYLQDNRFRTNYTSIILRAIHHIRRVLNQDLLNTYLESYSASLRHLYYTYVSQESDNEPDNDETTPRASTQVHHIKDSIGTNGFRSNNNTILDGSAALPTFDATVSLENSDVYSLIEIIRAKWMSSNESIRCNYLDRFRSACDKHFQTLHSQHSSTSVAVNSQLSQTLHAFFTSILDLLTYVTSSSIDISLKLKYVVATCLAWLIKSAQVTFTKKNYKTLCSTFKNIFFNGQTNSRQIAKLSVTVILLLQNYVSPQLVLNELIDEHFQYYNYRIQLELLAIVTATFIKHRQHHYENVANLNRQLIPILVSNRRELRHGTMECYTIVCAYFNAYKPLTSSIIETNPSIKLILSLVEKLSTDALSAFRFRLQRNSLPTLTDEGNVTPGLVYDATTANDPDAKFIALANPNSAQSTPSNSSTHESTSKPSANNSKLLQLAMPLAEKKTNTNDTVMRSRDIPPLKTTNLDHDSLRFTNNHHQFEPTMNPTVAAGGPAFDFAVTGNNSYRPLTLTERVFTDDLAKKLSSVHNDRREPTKGNQQQENNHKNSLLQVRPAIPHRAALGRFPASHNILVTSQIHNHSDQKLSSRRIDSSTDNDEGIDIAIDSRSVSNHASSDISRETTRQQTKKPSRSVHSSSTRRKVSRLFNNGNDSESTSGRTLTPENSNESGVYSQSGRDTEYDSNSTKKTNGKDPLFSTKPRLARSGSKSKHDKSHVPPSDSSSGQSYENNTSTDKPRRSYNASVEIVGRAYNDDKSPNRRSFNEHPDDKHQAVLNKPRAKLIKGSVANNSSNMSTNTNNNSEEGSHLDDDQDIGVVGKAVPMPLRANADMDTNRTQNNKLSKHSDNTDTLSDEFDSDSKENDTHVNMSQSLSASFRLRVQQKTQEKIEQKERRRQDRENRSRQQQSSANGDSAYENDLPISSTSTSRYSSQPDLTALTNEIAPTPRRPTEGNITSILPNFPSNQRFRVAKNIMARSQTFNNRRDMPNHDHTLAFNHPSSDDRATEQLRNPDLVYREAMESISNDNWEQKCSGLSLLQLLMEQYPDTVTQNLHQVVLVLIQEVKNLRSQVARFALSTFCDMFKYLKRNMDIELDLTVKAIIQKSAESNEFFKSDAEKCLQTMIENVTLQKALQALIAGGASHRNPAARKITAKYIYQVCEKIGPTKILGGTRDITERVLQVAATFASDGPPEIRWYGKKIYHMLMPYDELDSMMKHYLAPTAYTNMCDILDSIRAKGGVGETPSESARNNGRRTLSNDKLVSSGNLTSQFSSLRKINTADQAEQVRDLTKQMRSSDFRERLNGIEEFQKLCELETDTAIQSLVQIFDGFNDCLADMNSKVVLKALNTMHQIIPILGDALSSVINSALPLVSQNIASKNRDISQLASDIIDTAIEYIDCGVLIQPLCTLSQNSNLRIRPEIVLKLANIAPRVCQRKPKQVEIHLLPTYWKLLSLLRGQNSTAIATSASGSNSLNSSIHVLTMALYTELGPALIDKASLSSAVTPQNLQVLRELCANLTAE